MDEGTGLIEGAALSCQRWEMNRGPPCQCYNLKFGEESTFQ